MKNDGKKLVIQTLYGIRDLNRGHRNYYEPVDQHYHEALTTGVVFKAALHKLNVNTEHYTLQGINNN